ncbi:MAG: adenosine-specific kinase [Thermoplasmata archaeon]
MKFELITIKKPQKDINVIIGTSHFIKSVEDIYEALITAMPNIAFAVAFCEASTDRLVRFEGTDKELIEYAIDNAVAIGAGHSFVIMLKNAYPINVLNRLRKVDEVLNIFAATSNDLQVLVVESEQGRGIAGVIDGEPPVGIEKETDKKKRKKLLRDIGYKF